MRAPRWGASTGLPSPYRNNDMLYTRGCTLCDSSTAALRPPTPTHRLGKVLGAAVRQVVSVDAGQHDVAHAPVGHRLRMNG